MSSVGQQPGAGLSARLAGLVACLLVAATPRTAAAYAQAATSGGKPLFWQSPCVSYGISTAVTRLPNVDAAFSAVGRSFATWSDVEGSSLRIAYGGTTPSTCAGQVPPDLDNVVVWRETNWTANHLVLALTTVLYDSNTGRIYDADIEVNLVDHVFATDGNPHAADLEATITHEVGHVVGLDHSSDPEATMYERATSGELIKRDLAPDDLAGLRAAYPASAEPVACAPAELPTTNPCGPPTDDGDNGCRAGGAAGGSALALLGLLGLCLGTAARGRPGARARRTFGAALGLSALALAGGAWQAYRTAATDEPLRWPPEPASLGYSVARAGTGDLPDQTMLQALQASFATWDAVDCLPKSFEFAGRSDDPRLNYVSGGPNENVIYWIDRQAGWPYAAGAIAMTTLSYNRYTGEILDADMELNDWNFVFTASDDPAETMVDLRNTVTHEIGHILGLDHSDVPGATMAARSALGDLTLRDLAADDIEGVCAIYALPAPGSDAGGPDAGDAGSSDLAGAHDTLATGDGAAQGPADGPGAGAGSGCAAAAGVTPATSLAFVLGGLGLALRRRRRSLEPAAP